MQIKNTHNKSRHNNCTECNNDATEQLVINIYISRVDVNTADKFILLNKT